MAKKPQLELLREIFKDTRLHVGMGKITKLDLLDDRSELRVEVDVWPEQVGAVARMSWEQVGPESGVFGFPQVGDLVLLGCVDGNYEQIFVLKRLTSQSDQIPIQAEDGSTVIRSLPGKKVKIHSDTRINLGREGSDDDSDMNENVVLGKVFQTHQSTFLQAVSVHKHICMPPGYLSLPPDNAVTYTDEKASPIDDGAVLSDLAFTEK